MCHRSLALHRQAREASWCQRLVCGQTQRFSISAHVPVSCVTSSPLCCFGQSSLDHVALNIHLYVLCRRGCRWTVKTTLSHCTKKHDTLIKRLWESRMCLCGRGRILWIEMPRPSIWPGNTSGSSRRRGVWTTLLSLLPPCPRQNLDDGWLSIKKGVPSLRGEKNEKNLEMWYEFTKIKWLWLNRSCCQSPSDNQRRSVRVCGWISALPIRRSSRVDVLVRITIFAFE